MVYMHNRIFQSCRIMKLCFQERDTMKDNYIMGINPVSERQMPCVFSHLRFLDFYT